MGGMASQITGNSAICSTACSALRNKKASKLHITGILWGVHHRSPVDSPHKGPVMRKTFPRHDVTMPFQLRQRGGGWHQTARRQWHQNPPGGHQGGVGEGLLRAAKSQGEWGHHQKRHAFDQSLLHGLDCCFEPLTSEFARHILLPTAVASVLAIKHCVREPD